MSDYITTSSYMEAESSHLPLDIESSLINVSHAKGAPGLVSSQSHLLVDFNIFHSPTVNGKACIFSGQREETEINEHNKRWCDRERRNMLDVAKHVWGRHRLKEPTSETSRKTFQATTLRWEQAWSVPWPLKRPVYQEYRHIWNKGRTGKQLM